MNRGPWYRAHRRIVASIAGDYVILSYINWTITVPRDFAPSRRPFWIMSSFQRNVIYICIRICICYICSLMAKCILFKSCIAVWAVSPLKRCHMRSNYRWFHFGFKKLFRLSTKKTLKLHITDPLFEESIDQRPRKWPVMWKAFSVITSLGCLLITPCTRPTISRYLIGHFEWRHRATFRSPDDVIQNGRWDLEKSRGTWSVRMMKQDSETCYKYHDKW